MRRVVLTAAIAGRGVTDQDLATALDEMLADGAELTRALLDMERAAAEGDDDIRSAPTAAPWGFGWTAYAPLSAPPPMSMSEDFTVQEPPAQTPAEQAPPG